MHLKDHKLVQVWKKYFDRLYETNRSLTDHDALENESELDLEELGDSMLRDQSDHSQNKMKDK